VKGLYGTLQSTSSYTSQPYNHPQDYSHTPPYSTQNDWLMSNKSFKSQQFEIHFKDESWGDENEILRKSNYLWANEVHPSHKLSYTKVLWVYFEIFIPNKLLVFRDPTKETIMISRAFPTNKYTWTEKITDLQPSAAAGRLSTTTRRVIPTVQE